jgi:hypothetical protein
MMSDFPEVLNFNWLFCSNPTGSSVTSSQFSPFIAPTYADHIYAMKCLLHLSICDGALARIGSKIGLPLI